jgi:predicted DNA binding CopG/RHH family protein
MKKTKTVQYFTDEYLQDSKRLSPTQVVSFLEDFRLLHSDPGKSKLISIKIQERLLNVFRKKCELIGVPYQTQIKKLMADYLE